MARLYLRFENTTLKDFPLTKGGITIGRLPDNEIQVDNPAVSAHHARVFWEADAFHIEDKGSFNGTYINDQRVSKQALKDGDNILVGKHTLHFRAEPDEFVPSASTTLAKPTLPSLEATAMLDTKKARELLAQASGKVAALADTTPTADLEPTTTSISKMRLGVLSVISGKTDQRSYMLTGKLTVIGKSDMASIRLKGWFAPKVAGAINRHDNKYFIAASGGNQRVKVNGETIVGQRELQAGDMISVWKITMTFAYAE